MAQELQGGGVFGDGSDQSIWGAVNEGGFDFQGDGHRGTDVPDKGKNQFIGDLGDVAGNTVRVQGNRPMKAAILFRDRIMRTTVDTPGSGCHPRSKFTGFEYP